MVAHAALHDALQSECGCPGLSASTADDGSERASPVLRQHSSSGPPDTNEASSAPRLEHQGQPRPPDLAHSEPGTPAPNATAVGPCLLHRQAPQADEGDASSALFAAYPELLWEVARKALADEDDDVRAWARLSLVCKTFRDALEGVPLTFTQSGRSTLALRQWLETTMLPLRRVTFHREGYTGAVMLDDSRQALRGSASTLAELHNVRVPTDVDTQHGPTRHLHPAGSLTRFIALRALTLKNGGVRAGLPALPPTLTSLTLDDNTPNAIQMATRLRIAPRLRLGDMRELRELTLRGPWFVRYLFGRPDMPDAAATPPQLPAGFQALHLDLELAEHERAVPHVSLASLEALAKLSLVSISAPTIRVALLTNEAAVAGPPRLRLACTRLDVALARAVDCEPLGDDQLRPSQLLHWLSRLLAGNAELSLSCEPWQNVVVRLLRARNTFEDFENWTLQYNSVADLAAALRPHASEHGLSVRLAAQDTELVLEREL